MSAPLVKLNADGLWLWCPACRDLVRITVDGDGWAWDGDEAAPTINPSLLTRGGAADVVCHSFIRAGQWEFLSDSTHALAGQTVPMEPLPEWFIAPTEESDHG